MFVSALCFLQVYANSNLVWTNPSPGGTSFCKPIRISFQKEEVSLVNEEYARILREIPQSMEFGLEINSEWRNFRVQFQGRASMLDGKCLNTVSHNNATSRCHMCKKTAKQFMSDVPSIGTESDWTNPLSITPMLHSYIRSLEFFLKLAYKAPLQSQTYASISKADRAVRMAAIKKTIQRRIKTRLGVTVDQVKPVYGNTNTGNVARKCLRNPKAFSLCLDIDENVLSMYSELLECFTSFNQQDPEEYLKKSVVFDRYFKEKFPWANYTPTVHKVVAHGALIIMANPLPLGFMTEEPIESMIREIREIRLKFARKNSRKNNLEDVFNFLNMKSDFVVLKQKIGLPDVTDVD